MSGSQTDKAGRPLDGYQANKKTAWIVTVSYWVLSAIASMVMIFTSMFAVGSAIENMDTSQGGSVPVTKAETPAADLSAPQGPPVGAQAGRELFPDGLE